MIAFEITARRDDIYRTFTVDAVDIDAAAMQAVDDVAADEVVVCVRQSDADVLALFASQIMLEARDRVAAERAALTAEEVMDREG